MAFSASAPIVAVTSGVMRVQHAECVGYDSTDATQRLLLGMFRQLPNCNCDRISATTRSDPVASGRNVKTAKTGMDEMPPPRDAPLDVTRTTFPISVAF